MATTLRSRRDTLPVEELGAQARAAPSPGRVAATVVAGLFFGIGFVAGGLWRGLAFCAVSARYGYWKGLGRSDEEIAAGLAAHQAASTPPGPVPAPARA
jgi:hypothetical protein